MDSIKITTGAVRLCINDDPERVIEFNPTDVLWAERFYNLIGELEAKRAELMERAEQLDAAGGTDANGLPTNMGAGLALLRETCEFLRERIDYLFGPGTSQTVFGDAMTLDMFEQFFTGITPYVQSARSGKVERYSKPVRSKSKGKKVMR